MLSYIVRRLLLIIPTLIGISAITYVIARLAPGDPTEIQVLAGEDRMSEADSEKIAAEMRRIYGLDKPIHLGYLSWLGHALCGDLGNSIQYKRNVASVIAERVPNTLIPQAISIALILVLSLPLGVVAAARSGGWLDKSTGLGLYALYSLPDFWIALLLIRWFGVKLRWLPFYGMMSSNYASLGAWDQLVDRALHLVLPVICLTYASLAYMSRFARGVMLDAVRQDYIRTARAKGLSERVVIFKHALRNSMIPLLTLFGFLVPALLGGSVIIEYIFSWPGIGQLFFTGILTRDYPLIMGLSLLSATLVLIGNLLADLLYAAADPRISYA